MVMYLLVEGPFEQCVTRSSHHHKKQREMRSTTRPVPVQVNPQAHLIAVLACVKCWTKPKSMSVQIYHWQMKKICCLFWLMWLFLPGENMAGARPAMASCLFLVKSDIRQMKTPSNVVADISRNLPSISATVRSLTPTCRSSWRTYTRRERHDGEIRTLIRFRA